MSKLCFPIAAVILAGCIEPSSPGASPGAICLDDSDCDTASGEICDEGVCWGNPPAQAYAALLIPPPSEGTQPSDLVPTELPRLEISTDGAIQNLAFTAPVTLRGRVVLPCGEGQLLPACQTVRSIAAQIQIKRPSRILGGPPYVLRVSSLAGIEDGAFSFTVRLPPNEPGERYEVTLVPSHELDLASGVIPGEVAPPMRFHIEALQDRDDILWIVGDPAQHVALEGRVVDTVGMGIQGRRVFALLRSDSLALVERRSSVSITDADGNFIIRVPRDVLAGEGIALAVEPSVPGSAPILRMSNVSLPEPALLDGVVDLGLVKMPSYGELRTFTLPVRGVDGGGDKVEVPAAEVRVTTYLSGGDPNTTAIFTTQKFTDNNGDAQIDLIPGSEVENRRYLVQVVPPPGTEHASLYDYEIDIGSTQGGILAAVVLDRRLSVTGTLVTAHGEPVVGASVTADLTVGFRWSLDPVLRAHVDTLQLPKAVTDQGGHFVVWLEKRLFGVTPGYDLGMLPTDLLAPRWFLRDIDMSRSDESGTVQLGTLVSPRAAYARGTVLSPVAVPVAGAELRLYELADDHTPCTTADWPGEGGAECLVPARYQGPTHSRTDGKVTLVLPDASM